MKQLTQNQIEQVNGGIFVSGAWLIYGAYRAYKAYRVVRFLGKSAAGGYTWDRMQSVWN